MKAHNMKQPSAFQTSWIAMASALGLAITILAPRTAFAEADTFGLGSGRNGALNVTVANTSINAYASLTANASLTTNLAVDTVAGFAVGNLVMVWQTTGLSASDAPRGVQTAITLAGKNTGHYELARIESLGMNAIVLTNPLVNSYRADTAQIIRVPEYTDVTISGAGTIVPGQIWDGKKGGVVAFLANGTITNNGAITANAAGFRGGTLVNHATLNNCNAATMGVPNDGTPATGYSPKGEGLVPGAFNAAVGGRTNVANGGGGGVCHNSGGGGGAHIGPGGLGGKTWAGDGNGRDLGGYGGAPLVYDPLQFLSFGGGGGSGDENNNVGIGGGRGGGTIFIRGASLTGTGTMRANGEHPTRAGGMPAAHDAAGGGGAGGAIIVRLAGNAVCGGLQANGGDGGDVQYGNGITTDAHGPGGGGGGGRIYLQSGGGVCTGTTSAGVAGQWNSTSNHGAGPAVSTDPTYVGLVTAITSPYVPDTCTGTQLAIGLCGGCVDSAECSGTTPTCDLGSNACGGCQSDFGGMGRACPMAALPACLTTGANAGACVECGADSHCMGNANGAVCDTTTNVCGACSANNTSACTGATPLCDTVLAVNVCTACTGNFATMTAVACPTSTMPACVLTGPGTGTCAQCTTSNDCTNHPNGGVCDTTKRTCGTCAADNTAMCMGVTPVCDTSGAANLCANCNGDFASGMARACPAMEVPYCQVSGACIACRGNMDCGGTSPICNAMSATCGPCDGNFGAMSMNACPMTTPYCTTGLGSCSAMCTTDAQCGAGNWCNAGTCGPKVPNGQPVPGGLCENTLAVRACISGVCDPTDNNCGIIPGNPGCIDPLDCRAGACILAGGNAGRCLECNTNTDCTGATPVCHVASNLCVACGLNNTTQCTGATPVCNTAAGSCGPCTGDAGSATAAECPNGNPYCAMTGACDRCATNMQCMVGNHAGPICNPASGSCGTSCSVDDDCTASEYCDNPTAAAFAGTCAPKIPNGTAVPAGQPFGGMCEAPIGLRVCVSGVCDTDDDLCGLVNNAACMDKKVCRSDECHTDNMCGLPNGEACSGPEVCRVALCHSDAKCGLPNGESCLSTDLCRSGVCHADNRCGLPDGEMCNLSKPCRSGVCEGGKCGSIMPDAGAMDAMPMPGDGGAIDAAANNDGAIAMDAMDAPDAGPGTIDGAVGTDGAAMVMGGTTGTTPGSGGGAGTTDPGQGGATGVDPAIPPDVRIGGGGCNCNFGTEGNTPGWLYLGFGLTFLGLRRRRRK